MSSAVPLAPADAVALARQAMDAISELEVAVDDVAGALELTRAVEVLGRQVRSVQLKVMAAVEVRSLHRPDGHANVGVMAGHAGRLSSREAKRRRREMRAVGEMPMVAAGLAVGLIGVCHVDRIATAFANPRVRDALVGLDATVAVLASKLSYEEFDRRLGNWVRQVDEDGTADRASRRHENRDVRVVPEFDGGWDLSGGFGSLDGARVHDILVAFTQAEFEADWAAAYAIHGEATTTAHLARTDAQRRADATVRIFELAAAALAATPGGTRIETVVVIDQETFERGLRDIAGTTQPPRATPTDLDHTAADLRPDESPADAQPPAPVGSRFRCETQDGIPLDPTEVVANALVHGFRRAVVDSRSVTIDLGSRQRLYRTYAQLAVKLPHTTCAWPGCNVPVSQCQSDHMIGWKAGGRTSPGNGAPLCGRHNRHKEHGFTITRDQHGRLHLHRPDGTEID